MTRVDVLDRQGRLVVSIDLAGEESDVVILQACPKCDMLHQVGGKHECS